MKRWILGALAALLLVGAGVAIGAHHHGGLGRERVVVTAPASGGGQAQTIVIDDGRGWPGPFFPIVPLLVVGGLVVLVARRRGGGPCGPRRDVPPTA